jgi:hypothetical protein
VTVNREGPDTLYALLERALGDQPVGLDDREVPGADEDVAVLLEDGEVIASSPMSRLRDTLLLVNADRYRTSAEVLDEGDIPDVLAGLTGVEFTVRGFPASNKEKLLLIMLSRLVESRALAADGGTLDASFQRLSRLDDEAGTRSVYQRLGDSGIDVHVYGVRDGRRLAADRLPVTVHAGDGPDYRRSWLVVFTPPETGTGTATPEPFALVAVETGDNAWRGVCTDDPALVERAGRYARTDLRAGTEAGAATR